jgi:hypothetical protein
MSEANPGRAAMLFAEVSTTSGPRKAASGDNGGEDMELGEDSGGVLFPDGDSAIVWVADGTSETSRCGPFSSRILAQDLGKAFTMRAVLGRQLLNPSGWDASFLADCLRGTIRDVRDEWSEMLALEHPIAKVLAERIASMHAPLNPEGDRFLEFSTTFSAAGLNRGGQWQAASIGDSYLILNESGQTRFSALERGQITFRVRNAGTRLELSQHIPPIQHFDGTSANLICLSSDGTRETVQFLYETLHNDREFTLDQFPALKKKIARIKPRSQDDKTLALLGRFYPC